MAYFMGYGLWVVARLNRFPVAGGYGRCGVSVAEIDGVPPPWYHHTRDSQSKPPPNPPSEHKNSMGVGRDSVPPTAVSLALGHVPCGVGKKLCVCRDVGLYILSAI
jgi:hypothetical protein